MDDILYPESTNERGKVNRISPMASWDYGRIHALPVWTEFVLDARWEADDWYEHGLPLSYSLECLISGALNIMLDGVLHKVRPGEAFFLPAGAPNRIAADGMVCRKISFGFCGILTGPLMAALRLTEPEVFPITDLERLMGFRNEMFRLLSTKQPDGIAQVSGLTLEFLTYLSLCRKTEKLPPKLADALRFMEGNLSRNIRLEEIYSPQNFSYRQFYRLFYDYFGTSPKQYLSQLRMRKAKTLLRLTSIPIKEIAFQCGFVSPVSFSLNFFKNNHCSPRDFRKRVKSASQSGTK